MHTCRILETFFADCIIHCTTQSRMERLFRCKLAVEINFVRLASYFKFCVVVILVIVSIRLSVSVHKIRKPTAYGRVYIQLPRNLTTE